VIKLSNGAKVIRVTASENPVDGRWSGVVLAESGNDFVVWRIEQGDDGQWHTFNGDYFAQGVNAETRLDARERAAGRYDYRRGV
jgi:hypothetical protein